MRLGPNFACIVMANELAHLSDEALVELCRVRGTGDSRPFTELFHRHQRFVWRTCYWFVGNTEDTEDLVQEVFFKVYRSLAQFEGRASFQTWLYQIAANTARNELRRRSRRPQASQTPQEELVETLTADAAARAHPSLPRLAPAWERLRPEERQALHLKDLEQRPYDEITRILGISSSAAKMRVLRARLALQNACCQLEREEKTDHEFD
jgi:RNA polymerase sigma-70 factor (ECF subfamily)